MKPFLYNNKTKPFKFRLKLMGLYIIIFFKNLFRSRRNKITHLFFYSHKQDNIDLSWFPIDVIYNKTYVNGVLYSEMRELGRGLSNWEDCYIVAYGNRSNISY